MDICRLGLLVPVFLNYDSDFLLVSSWPFPAQPWHSLGLQSAKNWPLRRSLASALMHKPSSPLVKNCSPFASKRTTGWEIQVPGWQKSNILVHFRSIFGGINNEKRASTVHFFGCCHIQLALKCRRLSKELLWFSPKKPDWTWLVCAWGWALHQCWTGNLASQIRLANWIQP